MGHEVVVENANGKGIHLLLALPGLGEQGINSICTELQSCGINVRRTGTSFRKMGVGAYLSKSESESDPVDVLLVSEGLEEASPYTARELTMIREEYEGVLIIPILFNGHRGDNFLLELFRADVLNAILDGDTEMDTVASIIKQPRSRRNARYYYGIREEKEEFDFDLDACVEHITQGKNLDECREAALYVKSCVTSVQFKKILDALPGELRDKFADAGDFLEYLRPVEVEESAKSSPVHGVSKALGKVLGGFGKSKVESTGEEEERKLPGVSLELNRVLMNIEVGVCGAGIRSGTTTQAIAIANFLAKHSYRVAVLERNTVRHVCLEQFALSVGARVVDGAFSYNGVDYYPTMSEEKMDEVREQHYNFLISDFGNYNKMVAPAIRKCQIRVLTVMSAAWDLIDLVNGVEKNPEYDSMFLLVAGVPEDEREGFFDNLTGLHGGFVDGVSGDEGEVAGGVYTSIFSDYLPKGEAAEGQRKRVWHISSNKNSLVAGRASTGVFVTSLRHGAGATHFGIAMASLFADVNKATVGYCYSKSLPASMQKNRRIVSCPASDIADLAGQLRYVVIDGGVLKELPDRMMLELKRSQYKIMLCLSDDDYLHELARFVDKLGNAVGEWCFVFNMVPEEKRGTIRQLMKKYHYVIAPEFLATKPDAVATEMIRKILV